MQGIAIVPNELIVGTIRVTGWIHGHIALNAIVTYFNDPENWFMKQFVSQEQLEEFAKREGLAVQLQENK